MNQDKEVNVNWLRINVPSVVTIVLTGIAVSAYVQKAVSKIDDIDTRTKDRVAIVDKSLDRLQSQLQPFGNIPYRVQSLEQSMAATNQRMDTYLQNLGAKVDNVSDKVNGLTTKVEVLSQKIDTITPEDARPRKSSYP